MSAWLLRGLAAVLFAALAVALVEGGAAVALHFVREEPEAPPEIAAKIARPDRIETVPDPDLGYRLEPNVDDGLVRTNRFGLRGGPVEAQPGEGVFRVMLLGGSVAFGMAAASEAETPAPLLARALSERSDEVPALRGRRVEVLNGAVPAYVAWQSALAYTSSRHELGADLVISIDGINDVTAAIRAGRAGAPLRFEVGAHAFPDPRSEPWRWLGWRVQRMKVARLVRLARDDGRPLERYEPPTPAAVAVAWREALAKLADAAASHGARAMAVVQPLGVSPASKPLTDFERAIFEYKESAMPGRGAYFDACADALRRAAAALDAENPDLAVLDASGLFANERETAYADDTHLTPRGRALLVEALANRVAALR